jgi:hypothetical protein
MANLSAVVGTKIKSIQSGLAPIQAGTQSVNWNLATPVEPSKAFVFYSGMNYGLQTTPDDYRSRNIGQMYITNGGTQINVSVHWSPTIDVLIGYVVIEVE